MYDRTVTVNGVSKAYSMTGWRIGYIGAPEYIARRATKCRDKWPAEPTALHNGPRLLHRESPQQKKIQYMVDAFKERRKFWAFWQTSPVLNQWAGRSVLRVLNISYYFGKTLRGKTILSAEDFANVPLEEAGVATVTGEAFGDPNCIRISYAASEADIMEAMERIKKCAIKK